MPPDSARFTPPDPEELCQCGHPAAGHSAEEGGCYWTATPDDPDGSCPCGTFTRPVEEIA